MWPVIVASTASGHITTFELVVNEGRCQNRHVSVTRRQRIRRFHLQKQPEERRNRTFPEHPSRSISTSMARRPVKCLVCDELDALRMSFGREFSRALTAMQNAENEERYAELAEAADIAQWRFRQADSELKKHRNRAH